jgi:hypothetical protein
VWALGVVVGRALRHDLPIRVAIGRRALAGSPLPH